MHSLGLQDFGWNLEQAITAHYEDGSHTAASADVDAYRERGTSSSSGAAGGRGGGSTRGGRRGVYATINDDDDDIVDSSSGRAGGGGADATGGYDDGVRVAEAAKFDTMLEYPTMGGMGVGYGAGGYAGAGPHGLSVNPSFRNFEEERYGA